MITLLNTSIITDYGTFIYQPISLEKAKESLSVPCTCYEMFPCQYCGGSGKTISFDSAIGHQATAEILSELLGVDVPVNRQNFIQKVGSDAVVFKLKTRVPEGTILNREQIEEIGYDFGLLSRTT